MNQPSAPAPASGPTSGPALDRRTLIKAACAAGVGMLFPSWASGGESVAQATDYTRSLILVQLDGGNDGLNTVVPYTNAAYYAARPTLAVTASSVLVLNSTLGLNPMMSALTPAWAGGSGDLAIVPGVGYPNSNRSHFRGTDILHSASDENVVISDGWLRRLFAGRTLPSNVAADGILLSGFTGNPLYGSGLQVLAMNRPKEFTDRSLSLTAQTSSAGNPALNHLLGVQGGIVNARALILPAVTATPTFTTKFPTQSSLGTQALYVAQMLAAGVKAPVFKLRLGGFDNHSAQRVKHDDLLAQLAESLAALRAGLIEKGLWNNVMVMTYSEFGRRVEENGSQGTDHGTAAPHFVMGGKVVGGIYGSQPSLTVLDSRKDLIHTTDYRRLYASAATFLGVDPVPVLTAAHTSIVPTT